MMMNQPQQVDQNDVDDFYLDDILFELQRGDDHIQDANAPIGMEGVEMTTSPPIHLNQDFTKNPELRSSVSKHLMPVDSLCYDSTAAISSDSGRTKATMTEAFGQSSNLWNMSVCSGDISSYPVGSAMPSSTSRNIKSEFPITSPIHIQQVSQMHQHHQLRKQLLTQNIQQPHNPQSLKLQANAIYTNHTLQNHVVHDQHQSSPPLMPTIPQDRRQKGWLPNQQQLYLDSNTYGLQPQQPIFETQSGVFREKTHQNASHMFQQPGLTAPQQIIQKTMNQVNFQWPRISNKPNNSSQDDMQHSSQKSAMLGHHQSIRFSGQQKPLDLLQGVNPVGWPGASVDPTVHNQNAALSDWHCQAYLQIQSIKETCLPDLRRLHNKYMELLRKAPNSELAAKYGKTRVCIERMIKFLHTSRDDLFSVPEGKIYSQMKAIIRYINSTRSKTAASMQHCKNIYPSGSMSRQPQLHQDRSMMQPFSPQCGPPQRVPNAEINTTNSISNVSFSGSGKGKASTMLRNFPARRPQQTSMLTSYNSAQMETDQRTLGSLQAGSFKSAHDNTLDMQQTNFPPRTNINSFNSTRINVAPTATILPSFNTNNEMWNQNVQSEKLKQTMHQSPIEQRKTQVVQQTNELNDALVGHATCRSSRMQQLHSVCPAEFSPQILPSSSPIHLHATSPQACKRSVSSSIADTNHMLSPLSVGETSVQPATSPLILVSPSTSYSLAVDTEKDLSTVTHLTAVESIGHPRTLEREIVDINEPGTSTTSLLTDSTCANDNHHSHATARLIEAVKSLSSKAFHATLEDINYVMNVIDCIEGIPRGPVGQDLAADIRFHLKNLTDFEMDDGPGSTEKLRRNLNALVLGASSSTINDSDGDNFVGLPGQESNVESTSTSMNSRPKNELIEAISKEIKEINRKLVETLLELVSDRSNKEDRLRAQEGTTVRCTYTAVCFPQLLRPQCASSGTLPNFRLLLFVPEDYPDSSPVVLDVISDVPGEKLEELLDKAKAEFNMSLRTLSQPICLLEMARSWNASCRAAFTEFAQKRGGMSFSERFGSWEKCVTAP